MFRRLIIVVARSHVLIGRRIDEFHPIRGRFVLAVEERRQSSLRVVDLKREKEKFDLKTKRQKGQKGQKGKNGEKGEKGKKVKKVKK